MEKNGVLDALIPPCKAKRNIISRHPSHLKRKHEKQPNTRLTKQNNETRKSPCKPYVQSISWCPNISIASVARDLQRWYNFRTNTTEAMVSHYGVCKEFKKCYSNSPKKILQELPLYMEHKNFLQSLQIALKCHKNNKQPISHNISIHSTWKNGERKKKQSCSKLGFR